MFAKLIGRRIENIRIGEFDAYGDSDTIDTWIELTLDGGEKAYISITDPSGNGRFYALVQARDDAPEVSEEAYAEQFGDWWSAKKWDGHR